MATFGPTKPFPAGFLWGVSTAAHQCEGNNRNNQWWEWEAAGKTRSGERSGLACDWWNKAEDDFDIARDMGLNALRFSVEWSRIEPRPGEWDRDAIQRYRQMLAGLHQRGLRPFVCLHHFSNPLWFENTGAFLHPDCVARFERFARKVVEELGDLCSDWLTFNEPNVYSVLGYQLGEFPPGQKGKLIRSIRVLANMARAHARAYEAIHQIQPGANVGWTQNYIVFQPVDDASPINQLACGVQSYFYNDIFTDFIHRGCTRSYIQPFCGKTADIQGKTDFAGVNVYGRVHVGLSIRRPATLFADVHIPMDMPQGDQPIGLPFPEITPGSITAIVEHIAKLGKPVYVLENGVPDRSDRIRPWLLANTVNEMRDLIARGIDLRGYFHWTLTDNFEWNQGWHLRFGLVELDPETQQRRLRPSARLYGEIARSNGAVEDGVLAEPEPENKVATKTQ